MPPLGIKRLDRIKRFDKDYRKLDQVTQVELDTVFRELLEPEMPPGRHLKKMSGHDDVWEVRVSRAVRLTFQLNEDIAVLRRVGRHNILQDP